MQDQPRRLRRIRRNAGQSTPPPRTGWPFEPTRESHFSGRLRMYRRLSLVLGWTLLAMPIQAVCLMLPAWGNLGRAKIAFARRYWAVATAILGVRVRRIGTMARPRDGRAVVFVSNHSSWVDIAVLGGQLEGCFVAKDDVSRWPVIRTIARLGRTVFVSRQRSSTARETDDMRARLANGDGLILFPEGTTSDGARVLPFRTPFFAIAATGPPPIIQPVSIVYDRLGGLPVGRVSRTAFSWYGDMDIAGHFAQFGQLRGMRVSVVLHTPLDPREFADRKALAGEVWRVVATGADRLRQNRPIAA